MDSPLVLSLFPGIGLLDMAFEQEGFCVVRGPDLLWGGDVKRFHPPAGKFAGVIGGPPCQRFSSVSNINRVRYGEESLAENLIPEFERVVLEAQPEWATMENVPRAPLPNVVGYTCLAFVVNNRDFGAAEHRERRVSFLCRAPEVWPFQFDWWRPAVAAEWRVAATSSAGGRRSSPRRDAKGRLQSASLAEARRTAAELAEAQGLPSDFLADAPFTEREKMRVIANGVPLPMGRAVAKAVRQAMGYQFAEQEIETVHPVAAPGR